MICFLEEHPLDRIIYEPIIKELDDRKIKYSIYKLTDDSIQTASNFIRSNPGIKYYVNYGGSHEKVMFALLLSKFEKRLINLHGDEREYRENNLSFLDVIARLAHLNYVSEGPVMGQLFDWGIESSTRVFECPITSLSRKTNSNEKVDVIYICGSKQLIKKHKKEFRLNKNSVKIFDYSDGLPEDWKSIYKYIKLSTYIVSDSFIFSKPARYMNKHFFYLGTDVLETETLGISTHLVTPKNELNYYFNQDWLELKNENPKYGLTPLIKIL
jgi:hypothetical protein